jgi:hypothetical protein
MTGYSGTPLAKKLGIEENFRAALLHMPDDVRSELHDALSKCQIKNLKSTDLDFIFLFDKSCAALEYELLPAAKALAPAGMLWISVAKEKLRYGF